MNITEFLEWLRDQKQSAVSRQCYPEACTWKDILEVIELVSQGDNPKAELESFGMLLCAAGNSIVKIASGNIDESSVESLLGRYVDLLNKHGINSSQEIEFVNEHNLNSAFVRLARMSKRVKAALS